MPTAGTSPCTDVPYAMQATDPLRSPVLVDTIRRIAQTSPHVLVIIALKRRHTSEEVFFDLMSGAQFANARVRKFPLPGDENAGEEEVEVYMYQFKGEHQPEALRSAQCDSELQGEKVESS